MQPSQVTKEWTSFFSFTSFFEWSLTFLLLRTIFFGLFFSSFIPSLSFKLDIFLSFSFSSLIYFFLSLFILVSSFFFSFNNFFISFSSLFMSLCSFFKQDSFTFFSSSFFFRHSSNSLVISSDSFFKEFKFCLYSLLSWLISKSILPILFDIKLAKSCSVSIIFFPRSFA